jgi:hypothetical protein
MPKRCKRWSATTFFMAKIVLAKKVRAAHD